MGPKPKGVAKKKKADESAAGEDSEFAQMEIEELRETVTMYRNQLNETTFKRNFLQLEMVFRACHDTLNTVVITFSIRMLFNNILI
jgi:hypothetical protein